MTEKMKFETKDLIQENIAKIGQLFPEVLTEAKDDNGILKKAIDFDKLRQILSDKAINNRETYDFTWVGKKQAILEAATPIRKTLRPCKEESVNWDTTQNLYIEGDNLDVLKLLQDCYVNQVKMIYIDPPYNTGDDDLPYNDKYQDTTERYEEKLGIRNEEGYKIFTNTKSNGRFHSNWLNIMYPRLKLARNLLAKNGVIFVSIDDNELTNLQKICDEVFGAQNFIGIFSVENNPKGRKNSKFISVSNEYCIMYAKIYSESSFYNVVPKEASDMVQDENGDYIRNSGKRVLVGENFLNKFVTDFNSDKHYSVYYNDVSKDMKLIKEKNINEIKSSLLELGYKRYITFRENRFVENTYTANKFKELFLTGRLNIKESKIYEKHFSDKIQVKSMLTNKKYKAIVNNQEVTYELDLKTTSAQKLLDTLLGEKIFKFPKNISYLKLLTSLICSQDDAIILDFFSGSATTAHAVMKLNAEDGGNRKFIMVQLPELTYTIDKNGKEIAKKGSEEAYKAGYKNICEIGKERIRRAAKQIKGEHPEANFDGGFRVFKLAESNMKEVYFSPSEYKQDLLSQMTSNIKEDRTDMDLLYGCMLEWGLPLSYPHTSEKVGSYTIHNVNNGALMACFDENIPEDIIRHMAAKKPRGVVFRDAGFADSPAKINVGELFKLLSPDTEVKVI